MTTKQPLTRHVTSVFRTATDAQYRAGMDWYTDAHHIADALSTVHDISLNTAAGVLSALSPLNSWGANVSLAKRFIAAGGLDSGYLSLGLKRAQRIFDGADPLSVLTGPTSHKTRNFYLCILTAGETDAVCIDRHAFDIATNTRHVDKNRPKADGARYGRIADVYRAASRRLRVADGIIASPSQVQAVTWVTWRQRFWNAGAFDLKAS